MIIEGLISAICFLVMSVFSVLPNLPHFEGLENSLNTVLNLIFDNLQLLDIFIRPSTIKLFVPLLLVIANFEHVWDFLMFLLTKLPININR